MSFWRWVWVLIWAMFSVACVSSQAETPAISSQEFPTATQPPTLDIAITDMPTLSVSPTIESFPTPIPPTPRATLTPQPTATPRDQLTERFPTLFQLNSYLKVTVPDFYGLDYSHTLTPEDVNQDSRLEYVYRNPDGEILTGMFFEDINGDNQEDLIVLDLVDLAIVFWVDDHYADAYWRPLDDGFWRCNGALMEVHFEDWTGDGISEVIGDYVTSYGGSALCIYETNKVIIHCDLTGCKEVWSGVVGKRIEDGNTGGLVQQQINMRPVVEANNQPGIRALEEGFAISCCSILVEGFYPTGILTSTLTLYNWNGTLFETTDRQIVSFPRPFDIQPILSATSSKGALALVVPEYNFSASSPNQFCDLYIHGNHAGPRFGCRNDFTIVSWEDITGDDQEEVIVITYSAGYPIDREGDSLDEITCMHQHLLTFQYDGHTATEIANVTGCIIRDDLFGVRLEDLDGDSTPEIIAAPNDELGHRAYKWNGTQFVFWSELPEP